jgi:hypothetical protein
MTTEKLVNNALFGKTELASQKIELGSIDIFIEAYKKEAAKLLNIKSKFSDINFELGNIIAGLSSLPKTGNELITKMKDLGIDSELQKVQSVNSAIDGLLKSLNPIYKNIAGSVSKI